MERTFVYLRTFLNKAEKIGFNDSLQEKLEVKLLTTPKSGVVIIGSGGIRKLRFCLEGKGKSGGVRVFYFDMEEEAKIYFMALLSKSEKDNLSKVEINELRKMVDNLKGGK